MWPTTSAKSTVTTLRTVGAGAAAGAAAGSPASEASCSRIARSSLRRSSLGSRPSSSRSCPAAVAIRLERLRVPTRAVEREHQLPAEPLHERMLGDERLELADELAVATELEVGVDPRLERAQPQLLEAGDLRLRRTARRRSPRARARARARAPNEGAPRVRTRRRLVSPRPAARRPRGRAPPAGHGAGTRARASRAPRRRGPCAGGRRSSGGSPAPAAAASRPRGRRAGRRSRRPRSACRSSSASSARGFARRSAGWSTTGSTSSGPRIRYLTGRL